MIGNVASTTGTAPRNPAHPRTIRSVVFNGAVAVATITASGRATKTSTSAISVPSSAMSRSCDGNDEQAEREEHRQLGEPREAVVKRGHRLAGRKRGRPHREAGEVDREEPGPRQDVGRAERERDDRQRRDRVQAAGREVGAAKRLDRQPADRHADDRADPELLDEQQRPSPSTP